jgi:hypothetical protein
MSEPAPAAETTSAASPPRGRHRWRRAASWAALLGLYLLGVAHWWWFYNGGSFPLDVFDWPKEHAYCIVLRQAMETGQFPYHIPREFHGTDRFLGLPEINLWPQGLLLLWLPPGPFFLANTLVLYSCGFLGCLLLRRRYGLGLVAFTFLFLLFDFNGYITAHLSAGHVMWNGYFLLPFFGLVLLRWAEEGGSPARAVRLAFVLFAMMMQGSFHLVIWCWMFLLFFVLFNPRCWKEGLLAIGFSGLLCSCRILPAVVAFWGSHEYGFLSGYPTVTDLLESFVVLGDYTHPRLSAFGTTIGWWEYDMYLGLLGFAALCYLGVYLCWRGGPALAPYRFAALDGPLALLSVLSLSGIYAAIALLPLPFFNAERVSSRFLIIPIVILLMIASLRLQRLLETRRLSAAGWVLLLGGLLETAITLAKHSDAWRMVRYEGAADVEVDFVGDLTLGIVNRPDPVYVLAVQISAVASLLSVLIGLYVLWRAWRFTSSDRSAKSSPPAASTPRRRS